MAGIATKFDEGHFAACCLVCKCSALTMTQMEVCIPELCTGQDVAVKLLVQRFCKEGALKVQEGAAALALRQGSDEVTGVNAICTAICREACPELLGSSPSETAQVRQ